MTDCRASAQPATRQELGYEAVGHTVSVASEVRIPRADALSSLWEVVFSRTKAVRKEDLFRLSKDICPRATRA